MPRQAGAEVGQLCVQRGPAALPGGDLLFQLPAPGPGQRPLPVVLGRRLRQHPLLVLPVQPGQALPGQFSLLLLEGHEQGSGRLRCEVPGLIGQLVEFAHKVRVRNRPAGVPGQQAAEPAVPVGLGEQGARLPDVLGHGPPEDDGEFVPDAEEITHDGVDPPGFSRVFEVVGHVLQVVGDQPLDLVVRHPIPGTPGLELLAAGLSVAVVAATDVTLCPSGLDGRVHRPAAPAADENTPQPQVVPSGRGRATASAGELGLNRRPGVPVDERNVSVRGDDLLLDRVAGDLPVRVVGRDQLRAVEDGELAPAEFPQPDGADVGRVAEHVFQGRLQPRAAVDGVAEPVEPDRKPGNGDRLAGERAEGVLDDLDPPRGFLGRDVHDAVGLGLPGWDDALVAVAVRHHDEVLRFSPVRGSGNDVCGPQVPSGRIDVLLVVPVGRELADRHPLPGQRHLRPEGVLGDFDLLVPGPTSADHSGDLGGDVVRRQVLPGQDVDELRPCPLEGVHDVAPQPHPGHDPVLLPHKHPADLPLLDEGHHPLEVGPVLRSVAGAGVPEAPLVGYRDAVPLQEVLDGVDLGLLLLRAGGLADVDGVVAGHRVAPGLSKGCCASGGESGVIHSQPPVPVRLWPGHMPSHPA